MTLASPTTKQSKLLWSISYKDKPSPALPAGGRSTGFVDILHFGYCSAYAVVGNTAIVAVGFSVPDYGFGYRPGPDLGAVAQREATHQRSYGYPRGDIGRNHHRQMGTLGLYRHKRETLINRRHGKDIEGTHERRDVLSYTREGDGSGYTGLFEGALHLLPQLPLSYHEKASIGAHGEQLSHHWHHEKRVLLLREASYAGHGQSSGIHAERITDSLTFQKRESKPFEVYAIGYNHTSAGRHMTECEVGSHI